MQIPIQVVAPTISQRVTTMAQQWHPQNASPLATFYAYNNMPKNPKHFCSKFFVNDVNRTADEHIKIFEDALQNRNVQDEDVACRLFPYSLGEESFY